jgi:hypothetical protein
MNKYILFIIGIFLGALSWAVCPLVSDRFEPFDTGKGFIIGQLSMLVFAAYVGWNKNMKAVMLSVAGLYLGQNAYAYIFGTGETRAWAVLLLFTSIELCIVPLISGLVARGINAYLQPPAASI